MVLLGIDPGMGLARPGAICALGGDGVIGEVWDIPVLRLGKSAKASLDHHALARIVCASRAGHAFAERCWNRPGEGRNGALVGCYMAILATLTTAGIPWTAVAPQVWKRVLGVPAAKDGARAEAALIATYGVRSIRSIEHSMEEKAA